MSGMPASREVHYRRLEAISSAIYEDLGLAGPGDLGREHPVPEHLETARSSPEQD